MTRQDKRQTFSRACQSMLRRASTGETVTLFRLKPGSEPYPAPLSLVKLAITIIVETLQ